MPKIIYVHTTAISKGNFARISKAKGEYRVHLFIKNKKTDHKFYSYSLHIAIQTAYEALSLLAGDKLTDEIR